MAAGAAVTRTADPLRSTYATAIVVSWRRLKGHHGGTNMKAIAAIAAMMLLCGCAITSSYTRGPHGGAVHMIDGMSAGVAYKKADQLCPNGYNIISQQGQMTVECKVSPTRAEPTLEQPPSAPAATTASSAPMQDYAGMVVSAQKLSTQMGCGDVRATGGTTFQAQCSGYAVSIDCVGGTCRPMHTINN